MLDRLHDEVPGTPLLVAEYGIGTDDDDARAAYLERGLEVVHDAIERGIDVRGLFHWTAVDNYEWLHGYDVRVRHHRPRPQRPPQRAASSDAPPSAENRCLSMRPSVDMLARRGDHGSGIPPDHGGQDMPFVTTQDGTEIFYKDWGSGQPIMFHHGWPLSSDDWDAQMMFFLQHGYRVIAHDRRGHGRSTQTADGHDMDTYAADAAAVVEHLDLRDAVHVGHSTGGGEVARYVARHGSRPRGQGGADRRGAAADAEDRRQPRRPADRGVRRLPRGHRPSTGPSSSSTSPPGRSTASTGPARSVSEGVIGNWWRQGMMGGAKAHYEGIKAFSETDFTEDLKAIDVPTLVMHGDDDQVVPIADSAELSIKLLQHGTLKVYPGYPHGMCTTHADVINPDLLAFIQA